MAVGRLCRRQRRDDVQPGEAIAATTKAAGLLTVPGRIDDGAGERAVVPFESGPDKVPFIAMVWRSSGTSGLRDRGGTGSSRTIRL